MASARVQKRVADYKPDWRTCLGMGCGKAFWSAGPGNRLCGRCATKAKDVYVSACESRTVEDKRRAG